MRKKIKVTTIGVYGSDEEGFFDALKKANVQLLCDVRNHRGMRGSPYAFVNSGYLQRRLRELNIRYSHLKDLSPPPEIRILQAAADNSTNIPKRKRDRLSGPFIEAYETHILDVFDFNAFLEGIPADISTIALFCVEREPAACHRSLIATRLMTHCGLEVEDLFP